MMDERKMVFWKYDTPPYVLCGELEDSYLDGSAKVYGYSLRFSREAVIKIVSYDEGIKIKKQLDNQYLDYKKVVSNANLRLRNKITKLLD